MKKIFSVLLAALLLTLPMTAYAAPLTNLQITQTVQDGNTLYLFFDALDIQQKPIQDVASDQVSVTIGAITEKAETKPLSASGEGTCYIFLVDTSDGLYDGRVKDLRKSISDWVERMPDTDFATIITFGSAVTPLTDDFSNDKTMLRQLATSITFKGYQSQLYNAIETAFNFAARQSDNLPKKRAIIVVSDGVDAYKAGPTQTADDIIPKVTGAGIPLYVVCSDTDAHKAQANQLGRVADAAGGMLVKTKPQGISEAYGSYYDRIQNSYVSVVQLADETVVGQEQALVLSATHSGAVTKAQANVLLSPFPLTNPKKATAVPTAVQADTAVADTTTPAPEPTFLEKNGTGLLLGGVVAFLAVAAGLMVFLLKRKNAAADALGPDVYDPLGRFGLTPIGDDGGGLDSDQTVELGVGDGPTVALGNGTRTSSLRIKLTGLGKHASKEYEAPLMGSVSVGRRSSCNIVIANGTISGQHCMFSLEGDGVYLRDTDSSNGTYLIVGDQRVQVDGQQGMPVASGAVVCLGDMDLEITLYQT